MFIKTQKAEGRQPLSAMILKKTLAVGLDGKRVKVSPLQYVPAEGLNTPSVKQSVEKQECNYNECGK